jgi:sugar lactone lactonase YvrE
MQMRPYSIKQVFYTALLIFMAGCIITACTPKNIKPNTSATAKGAGDSTAVVDTLPSFYSPAGVAVDAAGNVYVADYGNNLIRKITPGGVVSTLAGSGTQGSVNAAGALASFNQPAGIAVDASGNVFVADAGNSLIRKIAASGLVTTLAGSDTTGTVNGPGALASFFNPTSVALDGSGNVYVADAGNNMIRMINSAGTVSTLASNGADTTITAVFDNPTGVAADAAGNVFVANYLNNDILKITPAGVVNVLAGTGLLLMPGIIFMWPMELTT